MEDSTAWWVCFVQFVARVESLILSYYPNKEIEFKPSSTSVGEHVSCRISWNPWFLIFPHTKESDWCLPGLLERWNMTRSEWYRYIYIYTHICVCTIDLLCTQLKIGCRCCFSFTDLRYRSSARSRHISGRPPHCCFCGHVSNQARNTSSVWYVKSLGHVRGLWRCGDSPKSSKLANHVIT